LNYSEYNNFLVYVYSGSSIEGKLHTHNYKDLSIAYTNPHNTPILYLPPQRTAVCKSSFTFRQQERMCEAYLYTFALELSYPAVAEDQYNIGPQHCVSGGQEKVASSQMMSITSMVHVG
jgi:hypothetical protein